MYSDWNSNYVASDLDAVIQYGSEVVDAHPLCNDYVELWDYEQPNGANEKVSEVILAAQFSNDESTWGRYGNQMHLFYLAVYQGNDIGGCKRDISGGREFSYVSATEYTMQVMNDFQKRESLTRSNTCMVYSVALTYENSRPPEMSRLHPPISLPWYTAG